VYTTTMLIWMESLRRGAVSDMHHFAQVLKEPRMIEMTRYSFFRV